VTLFEKIPCSFSQPQKRAIPAGQAPVAGISLSQNELAPAVEKIGEGEATFLAGISGVVGKVEGMKL
jgi:hypothetical protein